MKRFRYILLPILSLLLIYMGAGVAVMHYCSVQCEVTSDCRAAECNHCKRTQPEAQASHPGDECSVSIYKINLVNHTSEELLLAAVSPVFAIQLTDLLPAFFSENELLAVCPDTSPPSRSSRHYLALYAVFLI